MWFSLGIKNFAVKKELQGDLYQIFVSDFVRIWYKYAKEEELLTTCKGLNPLIEAPPQKLLEKILEIFKNISAHGKELSGEGDVIDLTISSKISSIVFKFKLQLQIGDAQMLFEHVTLPLMISAKALQVEHDELIKIIKDKETEIQEYKAEGVIIKRSHVITKPFLKEERNLKNQEIIDSLWLEINQNPNLFFGSNIHELFCKVGLTKTNVKEEQPEIGESNSNEVNENTTVNKAGMSQTENISDNKIKLKVETDILTNKKRIIQKQRSKLKF